MKILWFQEFFLGDLLLLIRLFGIHVRNITYSGILLTSDEGGSIRGLLDSWGTKVFWRFSVTTNFQDFETTKSDQINPFFISISVSQLFTDTYDMFRIKADPRNSITSEKSRPTDYIKRNIRIVWIPSYLRHPHPFQLTFTTFTTHSIRITLPTIKHDDIPRLFSYRLSVRPVDFFRHLVRTMRVSMLPREGKGTVWMPQTVDFQDKLQDHELCQWWLQMPSVQCHCDRELPHDADDREPWWMSYEMLRRHLGGQRQLHDERSPHQRVLHSTLWRC